MIKAVILANILGSVSATYMGVLASSSWPALSGHTNDTGRSIHIGPQSNNVTWIYMYPGYAPLAVLGKLITSPAIGINGTLYFGSVNSIVAFSKTGKLIWLYIATFFVT